MSSNLFDKLPAKKFDRPPTKTGKISVTFPKIRPYIIYHFYFIF